MCTEAIINGNYISCIGELKSELGGKPVIEDCYSDDVKNCEENGLCLCPVDWEKTAVKYGYSVEWHGWDDKYAGEVELQRINP